MKTIIPLLAILTLITSCSKDKFHGEVSFLEMIDTENSQFHSFIESNHYYSDLTIESSPINSTGTSFQITMKSDDSVFIEKVLLEVSNDLNVAFDSLSQMKQIELETELYEAEKMDSMLQDSLQVVAKEMDQFIYGNGNPHSDSLQTIRHNYNEMIRLIDSTKAFIELRTIMSRSNSSSANLFAILTPVKVYPINRLNLSTEPVVVPQ